MKTTEQIKSEVVNYLNNTSKHLFVNEKGEFYKVLVEGNNFIVIDGEKVSTFNIDEQVSWYDVNTKNVIKHSLFLNKKLKSIKSFKTIKEKYARIKEVISGKTDKSEITKLVKQELTGIPAITEEKKSFISKLFSK